MWKRSDSEPGNARPATAAPTAATSAPPTKRGTSATIGPSINIRGDVTGSEDLVIQGRIDGTVTLKQHNVTVGAEGRVKANISGRVVVVEGEVQGDLCGDEHVILRRSAKVDGNISAPRVTLEDGAVFRGGIDMREEGPGTASPRTEEAQVAASRGKISTSPEQSATRTGGASKG